MDPVMLSAVVPAMGEPTPAQLSLDEQVRESITQSFGRRYGSPPLDVSLGKSWAMFTDDAGETFPIQRVNGKWTRIEGPFLEPSPENSSPVSRMLREQLSTTRNLWLQ